MKFLFFVALTILSNVSLAQSVTVAPSRIFLRGMENGELSETITISNNGKLPIILQAGLKDWERDTLGRKQYFGPGTLKRSNAKFLRIEPELVEVMPGQSKDVKVSMKVQEEVQSEQVTNSMLFFTQINSKYIKPEQVDGKRVDLTLKLQLGVHVYHIPNGLYLRDVEFLNFKDMGFIEREQGDSVRRLKLSFRNTGQLVLDGKLKIELTNLLNGEDTQLATINISMLPDELRHVFIDLPPGEKGDKYLAVAIVDSGTEMNLKVAEKEITY